MYISTMLNQCSFKKKYRKNGYFFAFCFIYRNFRPFLSESISFMFLSIFNNLFDIFITLNYRFRRDVDNK